MSPTIHATCLLVGPHGVLIRGPAGAGKTSLALALIEHAEARARFARLVADDRVALEAVNGRLVARAPAALAGLVERRGLGIVAIDTEPAAVLALVVDIETVSGLERMPEAQSRRIAVSGVWIARIAVPAAPDRSIPLILAALGTESGA
jgi:serine kinase of HPr protein (carbohydrate metabolism regulator)